MTRESQLIDVLTDWLEDQPDRAPSRVLDTVITDLQTTPQSASWKLVLRRIPMFNSNGARYFAVAVVGVLAVVIGVGLWAGAGGGVGSTPIPTTAPTPSPTATPRPTAPLATATPTSVEVPRLGSRFTSTIHDIALSYPDGWVTRAATEPWTTQGIPYFEDANVDVMFDPALTDHMFLSVSSQSRFGSRQRWATALAAGEGCEIEEMDWDGGTAFISRPCRLLFVAESDLGWAVRLYAPDVPAALEPAYDQLFEEIVGTVDIYAVSCCP